MVLTMTERSGDKPAQSRAGAAIEAARKRRTPPMSLREAARRMGFSATRWAHLVEGARRAPNGEWEVIRGDAKNIAKMAAIVGLSPEGLERADRPDAAILLRALLTARTITAAATGQPDTAATSPDIDQLTPIQALAARLDWTIGDADRSTVIAALASLGYRVVRDTSTQPRRRRA